MPETVKQPETAAQLEPLVRPLSRRLTAVMKRRFLGKQKTRVDGSTLVVEPELLPFRFGDGKQVIGIRPLALRRSWYVVAIDSRMEIGRPRGHFDEDDAFRDLLDAEIYPELEEHFGHVDSDETETDEFDAHAAWPMVNHSVGHEWFWLGDL